VPHNQGGYGPEHWVGYGPYQHYNQHLGNGVINNGGNVSYYGDHQIQYHHETLQNQNSSGVTSHSSVPSSDEPHTETADAERTSSPTSPKSYHDFDVNPDTRVGTVESLFADFYVEPPETVFPTIANSRWGNVPRAYSFNGLGRG
jgi:hypothetical protein